MDNLRTPCSLDGLTIVQYFWNNPCFKSCIGWRRWGTTTATTCGTTTAATATVCPDPNTQIWTSARHHNYVMQIKALAQSLFGSKKWCFLLQYSANYKYKITTSSYYMHVNNYWTMRKTGKAKKEKEKEERENNIIKCFDEIKEVSPPFPNPSFRYHCTIIFIIMHNDPETNASETLCNFNLLKYCCFIDLL